MNAAPLANALYSALYRKAVNSNEQLFDAERMIKKCDDYNVRKAKTMQFTKNHIYQNTDESYELEVFVNNHRDCYNNLLYVQRNLQKHYDRGHFDLGKAIVAMYNVATYSSKMYEVYFGYTFSTRDRFTVACELLADWLIDNETIEFDEVDLGNWLFANGRISEADKKHCF